MSATTATTNGAPAAAGVTDAELRDMLDERAIRDVLYRYCRGIDRCDFDLVRSCYHPDAIDRHGSFEGGVDEFIEFVQHGLQQFERTVHFVGNVLVEVDGDDARAESYTIAHHHLPQSRSKPERDYVVWLRYVDDFERRDGVWRIANRACVFDWGRIDEPAHGWWHPESPFVMSERDGTDLVYAPSVAP